MNCTVLEVFKETVFDTIVVRIWICAIAYALAPSIKELLKFLMEESMINFVKILLPLNENQY